MSVPSNSSDPDQSPVIVPGSLVKNDETQATRISSSPLRSQPTRVNPGTTVFRRAPAILDDPPWHYGKPFYGNPLKLDFPPGSKILMVGQFHRHSLVTLSEYTPGSDWNSRAFVAHLDNPYEMVLYTFKSGKEYYIEALHFVTEGGSLGWYYDRWRILHNGKDTIFEAGFQDKGGTSGAYDQLFLRIYF